MHAVVKEDVPHHNMIHIITRSSNINSGSNKDICWKEMNLVQMESFAGENGKVYGKFHAAMLSGRRDNSIKLLAQKKQTVCVVNIKSSVGI